MSENAPRVPTLSALVVVRNEEARLAACLNALCFADEIVVVLDRCVDRSKEIARRFGARRLEGEWELEGPRRNAGIAFCRGEWIFEVDADERVSPALAKEVRETIASTPHDWHVAPVDNYIGGRLVRHGWGCSFGKAGCPALFRRGVKEWGDQRAHPALCLRGVRGATLKTPLRHDVDDDISDMIRRLDRYTSARAADLRDSGEIGSLAGAARSGVSRFVRVYLGRKGYREGKMGVMVALCTALYPIVSHIKAAVDPPGLERRP